MEFGVNALLFRSHFRSRARRGLEPRRGQSTLRFRIDAPLGEARSVIAFPRRDLRFDTLSPFPAEPLQARDGRANTSKGKDGEP